MLFLDAMLFGICTLEFLQLPPFTLLVPICFCIFKSHCNCLFVNTVDKLSNVILGVLKLCAESAPQPLQSLFVSGLTHRKGTAISVNRLDSMMLCARGCDV